VEVLETDGRGSATRLAAQVSRTVDRVVAVGGDGTLNEVLNGLFLESAEGQPTAALAFLPSGTGNGAARAFGVGADPNRVGRVLATAKTRAVDIGMVRHSGGTRAFLLWLGAGWDAVLIRALSDSRTGVMGVRGLARGVPHVLGAMTRYREVGIDAVVEGQPFGSFASVIVANVGHIPFGGLVTDAADPADGHLNMIGLPSAAPLRTMRLMYRMLTKGLTSSKEVAHTKCENLSLSAERSVPIQADGEPIGELPVSVEVLPGAIRFLCT
jgi:diacylglycerol kinase family enzyme